MRISDWSSDVCSSDLISLLVSYQANARPRLLGDVIRALKNDIVVDPIFGMAIPREDLIDHVEEDVLNSEEARINRRSEERRVGQAGVSKCSTRWSRYH